MLNIYITMCFKHTICLNIGQKKKGKKVESASSTSSSSRSGTPVKGVESADKTIADAANKLKDINPSGKEGRLNFVS